MNGRMPYLRLCLFLFSLEVASGSVSAMTAGDAQVHRYTAARDHTIQTEDYPAAYPSPENYTWEWSADRGHWRLFFFDFQLACAEGPRPESDLLTVKDDFGSSFGARERNFGCFHRRDHMVQTPQTVKGSRFQLFLSARVPSDQRAKGFRLKVLYGNSLEDVERKVSNLQATAAIDTLAKDDGATWRSHVQLVLIAVATVVVALMVAATACCVLLLRHRRHNHRHPRDRPHQTTSTSLHLSIGEIRRGSSVTYSRHGNGPVPSGSRSRMNSEESTASEVGSLNGYSWGRGRASGRPVKRSDSWACRAEMASPARLGSTASSSGSGGGGDPHGQRPSLLHPSSDLPPSLSPSSSTSTRSARDAAAATESASSLASARQNCSYPFPEGEAIAAAFDSGSSSDSSAATAQSSRQATRGAGRTKPTPIAVVQDRQETALKLPRGRESSNVADDAEGLVVDDNDNDDDDAVFAEAPKKLQKLKQQAGKIKAKEKDKDKKKKKHEHKNSQQPAQTATQEAGSRRTAREPPGGTEEEDGDEREEEGPGIGEDACRLSTISEESRSSASAVSKLRVNLPVPAPKLSKGDGSLAVSNCGYIIMTGRAADGPSYVNLAED